LLNAIDLGNTLIPEGLAHHLRELGLQLSLRGHAGATRQNCCGDDTKRKAMGFEKLLHGDSWQISA
jgi:hypothetical protein